MQRLFPQSEVDNNLTEGDRIDPIQEEHQEKMAKILADYTVCLKRVPQFYTLGFILEQLVKRESTVSIIFHPNSPFFNAYPCGLTGAFITSEKKSQHTGSLDPLNKGNSELDGEVCFREFYGHVFLEPIRFKASELLVYHAPVQMCKLRVS